MHSALFLWTRPLLHTLNSGISGPASGDRGHVAWCWTLRILRTTCDKDCPLITPSSRTRATQCKIEAGQVRCMISSPLSTIWSYGSLLISNPIINGWCLKWKTRGLGNEVRTTVRRHSISLPHHSSQFYGSIAQPHRGPFRSPTLNAPTFTIQNEWFLGTTSLADETDDDGMLVIVGVALQMMKKSGGGQCLYLPKVSVLNVIQFPSTSFH